MRVTATIVSSSRMSTGHASDVHTPVWIRKDACMAKVDPALQWWTTTDVATFLGVRVGTVSSYRKRGQMPAPDQTYGRTHLWRPETIIDWHRSRPRAR